MARVEILLWFGLIAFEAWLFFDTYRQFGGF